jgi:lysophospholipase L1-like esterase
VCSAPRLTAQQAPPPAAPADRWEPAIAGFEEQDRLNPPPTNGIVFVGASSIAGWNLPASFPELGPNVINRGFGGSLLADSVKYADRIVIPYKPRIVVLYAGDNDVAANASDDEILQRFSAFDQKVHGALPDATIIFISIKPSITRWQWIETIRAANARIKDYTTTHPNLVYVDIERQMLGADGKPNPDLLIADGLHMTSRGYQIWNAALGPLVR